MYRLEDNMYIMLFRLKHNLAPSYKAYGTKLSQIFICRSCFYAEKKDTLYPNRKCWFATRLFVSAKTLFVRFKLWYNRITVRKYDMFYPIQGKQQHQAKEAGGTHLTESDGKHHVRDRILGINGIPENPGDD